MALIKPFPLTLPPLVLLSLFLLWPRVQVSPQLFWGLVGAIMIVSVALLMSALKLSRRATQEGVEWGAVWRPRPILLGQGLAQLLIYTGFVWGWETARDHLPLLVAQLAFAYLVDIASVWRFDPVYRLGLAPVPIVLSTNLFLFFTDAHYMWQWPMIALAVLSRELKWWRVIEGERRKVHIFNPSAIALSLTALTLILTEQMHTSWGEAVALAHSTGPYSYELVFVAGLVVSVLFGVGLTILSATLTLIGLGALYTQHFQGAFYYLDTAIPAAVFLGVNLLVTDPATSPRSKVGKLLYGVMYGLLVFVLYGFLRGIERPPMGDDPGLSASFCDKLLAVPLLNLMTPLFDRLAFALTPSALVSRIAEPLDKLNQLNQLKLSPKNLARLCFVLVWGGLFVGWVHPQLRHHPGGALSVWLKACDETPQEERAPFACENRDRLYRKACERGSLESCHNLALSLELGEAGSPNLSAATPLYEKACEGGRLLSCHHLGGLYVMEAERLNERALAERAEPLLKRACEGELWASCSRLALLISSRWAQEDRRAETWALWTKACEHKEPFACLEVGQRALQPPQQRASECAQGDYFACASLRYAEQAHPTRHPQLSSMMQAREALTYACQGELWVACANVGWMMWRGDGGPVAREQGVKLMQRACDGGLTSTCERAEQMRLEQH